jgi:putative ABC transport system permease protein
MTIAMGLFNSVMARTINQNNKDRIEYNLGADMVVQEYWPLKTYMDASKEIHWYYNDQDFGRYSNLEGDLCNKATRVIYDDNTTIDAGDTTVYGNVLMGINTKEFGETAELKDGVTDEHWYNYLNALAGTTNGVIISSNLAEKSGVTVGDSIAITRYNPISSKSNEYIATVNMTVCAITDAFPGFQQYSYELDEDGNTVEVEKYLVVANYAYIVSAFTQTPYQVWFNLNSSDDGQKILDYLEEQDIDITEYQSKTESISEMQEKPMVLITNGLFSLSFIIAIVLCTIGFLIYWITSIKQRELLFGIYRAMGMSMREINKMLINEQIFGSFLASIAGYGVGALSVALFVKLIAIVYLPESHNLAIVLAVNPFDIIKLTIVVVVMFIICFVVIRTILKRMNITQALKLGED